MVKGNRIINNWLDILKFDRFLVAFSKYFFQCLHVDISSCLVFSELSSGWQIIINFSYRYRLHLFVLLEQGLHCLIIILHLLEYRTSDIFQFQIYLLSSVACLRFGFQQVLMWLWYIVLNVPSVCPTYVFSCPRCLLSSLWLGKWPLLFGIFRRVVRFLSGGNCNL